MDCLHNNGPNGHLFYVGGDLMMRRGMLPIIMLPDGDLRIVLHLVPFWILTIWGSVHIVYSVWVQIILLRNSPWEIWRLQCITVRSDCPVFELVVRECKTGGRFKQGGGHSDQGIHSLVHKCCDFVRGRGRFQHRINEQTSAYIGLYRPASPKNFISQIDVIPSVDMVYMCVVLSLIYDPR